MKTRFLKTRVAQNEHQFIAAAADAQGLTISEFVRNSLMNHQQTATTESVLQKILERLPKSNKSESADQLASMATVETLYLVRELTLARDPQALARVNAKLDRQFGAGRIKA